MNLLIKRILGGFVPNINLNLSFHLDYRVFSSKHRLNKSSDSEFLVQNCLNESSDPEFLAQKSLNESSDSEFLVKKQVQ